MSQLVKVKEKSLNDIACPICKYNKSELCYIYSYENNRSDILECLECRHLYINPVPLVKLDSRSMDSVEDGELFNSGILRAVYEKIVIQKEINAVKKVLPREKRVFTLLDIACGTGWTTSIWQKSGFDVTGLESSVVRSQYCREKYNSKIFTGFIENFHPEEQFDVITMRHILEHIEHPVAVLEKVKSFLKVGGVLLITLPNINSIGRYMFEENWSWILPWHLHFYHPKTLELLLEKLGLRKLKIYQMPSPLWYPDALSQCLGTERLAGRLFNKLPRWFQMVLFSPVILLGTILGLNDNLTIIVKKIE